ncbi:MAG: ATP-dependent helicase [Firmicutes bacterium]|nr:ATP-dependent helicase [Bacillota bacterium]
MAKSNTITLTEKQKECVEYTPDQHLLVRGIAGSGKSTVLIERARRLMRLRTLGSSTHSVLVLTYNKALANYMAQLGQKTGTDPIPVKTFHSMAWSILASMNLCPNDVVSGRERLRVIEQAVKDVSRKHPGHRLFAQPLEFWDEEITWMKGRSILDFDTYSRAERTGRGTSVRVTTEDRRVIFDVFERYQRALKREGWMDHDDFANVLMEHIDEIPEDQRIDHLLIDEAQDLHESQLCVCAGICNVALTIAADKAQNIYRTGFTWRSVGIDIRGRSKVLDNTHRSTREIVRLAMSLQRHDPIASSKDEEFIPTALPARAGPLPVLFSPATADDELDLIATLLRELRRMAPASSIGVIARSHQRIREIELCLRRSNIESETVLKDQGDVLSPGVKLTTFHSAKGLEFDHVIVTGLSEGILPENEPLDSAEEDLKEWLAVERRLLYVATTRAKTSLILIAPRPRSRFVDELDSSLYEDGGLCAVQRA